MKKSIWFAFAGFLIGSGAPLGALALRAFQRRPRTLRQAPARSLRARAVSLT